MPLSPRWEKRRHTSSEASRTRSSASTRRRRSTSAATRATPGRRRHRAWDARARPRHRTRPRRRLIARPRRTGRRGRRYRRQPGLLEIEAANDEAGSRQHCFVEGDVRTYAEPDRFDAAVGRLILFHLAGSGRRRTPPRARGSTATESCSRSTSTRRLPGRSRALRWPRRESSTTSRPSAAPAPTRDRDAPGVLDRGDAGLAEVTSFGIEEYIRARRPDRDRASGGRGPNARRSTEGADLRPELELETLEQRLSEAVQEADAVRLRRPRRRLGPAGRLAPTRRPGRRAPAPPGARAPPGRPLRRGWTRARGGGRAGSGRAAGRAGRRPAARSAARLDHRAPVSQNAHQPRGHSASLPTATDKEQKRVFPCRTVRRSAARAIGAAPEDALRPSRKRRRRSSDRTASTARIASLARHHWQIASITATWTTIR